MPAAQPTIGLTLARCPHARQAALAMTFGQHLAASVRGLPCAPPRA